MKIDGDLVICDDLLVGLDAGRVIGYEFSANEEAYYTFNRIPYLDSTVASGLYITTFECDSFNSVLVYDKTTGTVRKFEYQLSTGEWVEVVLSNGYTGAKTDYLSERVNEFLLLLNLDSGKIT